MSILVSLCYLKIEIVRDMSNDAGKSEGTCDLAKFRKFSLCQISTFNSRFPRQIRQLKEQFRQSTQQIRDWWRNFAENGSWKQSKSRLTQTSSHQMTPSRLTRESCRKAPGSKRLLMIFRQSLRYPASLASSQAIHLWNEPPESYICSRKSESSFRTQISPLIVFSLVSATASRTASRNLFAC